MALSIDCKGPSHRRLGDVERTDAIGAKLRRMPEFRSIPYRERRESDDRSVNADR